MSQFLSQFKKVRVLTSVNTNVYWWPEAESNCRPLVFQTEANHLTFPYFTLIIFIYGSFLRGSTTQWVVNNEDFFCEYVPIMSHFRCWHHHILTHWIDFLQLIDAEKGLWDEVCSNYATPSASCHLKLQRLKLGFVGSKVNRLVISTYKIVAKIVLGVINPSATRGRHKIASLLYS